MLRLVKEEISAWGLSLVQRSPGECCVSERVRSASKTKRPWPQRVVPPCRMGRGGGGEVGILIQNLIYLEEPIQKRVTYFRILLSHVTVGYMFLSADRKRIINGPKTVYPVSCQSRQYA